MKYIEEKEIFFKSSKDIVTNGQAKFFNDQRELLEKKELTKEDYEKSLDLSARNLTEYIIFRQIQIDRLKKVTSEDKEEVIHNLISPKGNFYPNKEVNKGLFANNAWILDDRFMSFTYAGSDKTLKELSANIPIFDNSVPSSQSLDRPDYVLLFSNRLDETHKNVDVVVFEFKKLGMAQYNASIAKDQLLNYASKLKKICPKINKVWLYALIEFNENIREILRNDEYKEKFSVHGEVWSKYNNPLSLEISFLDFMTLVNDADSRNKVFMDILRDKFIET
ncbi:hypothetical protein [Stenoxybacter acetivorans]|uniref:hypothetical protein n=1 Tax=Stenoxybacter acetivorans TaxID=422441 RepID=UPI00068AFCDD|nr:hypothetical protein [Stenoxybacter acetivorans]